MKCKDCKYLQFESAKDGCNRYRCDNPEATKSTGYKKVCRCDRHSNELKIKNSPRWCPLKEVK